MKTTVVRTSWTNFLVQYCSVQNRYSSHAATSLRVLENLRPGKKAKMRKETAGSPFPVLSEKMFSRVENCLKIIPQSTFGSLFHHPVVEISLNLFIRTQEQGSGGGGTSECLLLVTQDLFPTPVMSLR